MSLVAGVPPPLPPANNANNMESGMTLDFHPEGMTDIRPMGPPPQGVPQPSHPPGAPVPMQMPPPPQQMPPNMQPPPPQMGGPPGPHPQMMQMQHRPPGSRMPHDATMNGQSASMGRRNYHIPLSRCRVLYLGSAVPIETSKGIEAVQQPLRERYPIDKDGDVPGIDAWLNAYSSGLQMQYISDKNTVLWFPINTLHVCAAVKPVIVVDGSTGQKTAKFVSLDTEAAEGSSHPPMFAAIMRRTTGVKVLECHVFIAKNTEAAMSLVQSCTHAYEHKEGWSTDSPPIDMSERTGPSEPMRLVPADPVQQSGSAPEFFESPPPQGYFYATKKELVKKYNVAGGGGGGGGGGPPQGPPGVPSSQMGTLPRVPIMGPPPHLMAPPGMMPPPMMMGPPHPMMGPPPPMMGPPPPMMIPRGMPPPPPHMLPPGPPFMGPPPPGYFRDWDSSFGGPPVAVFPTMPGGEIVYEGERRHRHKRDKKHRAKSPRAMSPRRHGPHRSKSPLQKHYHRHESRPSRQEKRERHRDRYRSVSPHYDSRSSSEGSDPDMPRYSHHIDRRPTTPPADYAYHHGRGDYRRDDSRDYKDHRDRDYYREDTYGSEDPYYDRERRNDRYDSRQESRGGYDRRAHSRDDHKRDDYDPYGRSNTRSKSRRDDDPYGGGAPAREQSRGYRNDADEYVYGANRDGPSRDGPSRPGRSSSQGPKPKDFVELNSQFSKEITMRQDSRYARGYQSPQRSPEMERRNLGGPRRLPNAAQQFSRSITNEREAVGDNRYSGYKDPYQMNSFPYDDARGGAMGDFEEQLGYLP